LTPPVVDGHRLIMPCKALVVLLHGLHVYGKIRNLSWQAPTYRLPYRSSRFIERKSTWTCHWLRCNATGGSAAAPTDVQIHCIHYLVSYIREGKNRPILGLLSAIPLHNQRTHCYFPPASGCYCSYGFCSGWNAHVKRCMLCTLSLRRIAHGHATSTALHLPL